MRVMLQPWRKLLRGNGMQCMLQGPWVDGGVAAGGVLQCAGVEGVCEAARCKAGERVACMAERVGKGCAVEEGLQDAVEIAGVAEVWDARREGVEAGALGRWGGGVPQGGGVVVRWRVDCSQWATRGGAGNGAVLGHCVVVEEQQGCCSHAPGGGHCACGVVRDCLPSRT